MIYYICFKDAIIEEEFLIDEMLDLNQLIGHFIQHKGYMIFFNNFISLEKKFENKYLNITINKLKNFWFFLDKNNRLLRNECQDVDYFINYSNYKPSEFINIIYNLPSNIVNNYFDEKLLYFYLDKIIKYSKIIKIIDPYFSIFYKQDICEFLDTYLGYKTNLKKFKIEIHLNKKCDFKFYEKNLKLWKDFVCNAKNDIEVYIWDDTKSIEKMHDRFFITDKFVVTMGKGLEKHTNEKYYTLTNWGLKDLSDTEKIVKIYKENSSPFKLKDKITKGD